MLYSSPEPQASLQARHLLSYIHQAFAAGLQERSSQKQEVFANPGRWPADVEIVCPLASSVCCLATDENSEAVTNEGLVTFPLPSTFSIPILPRSMWNAFPFFCANPSITNCSMASSISPIFTMIKSDVTDCGRLNPCLPKVKPRCIERTK